MGAVEEHKPAEKRRALGRGLDSLLPAGPRMVPAAPAASAASGPIAIPAPSVALPQPTPVPGEIAEIHAGREQFSPKSLDGAPDTHAHPTDGNTATATRAGAPAPHT